MNKALGGLASTLARRPVAAHEVGAPRATILGRFGYGIEAEASRQATRGENRRFESLWRVKARDEGRLLATRPPVKSGDACLTSRNEAFLAWRHIMEVLTQSDRPDDQALAGDILRFARESPYLRNIIQKREPARPVRPAPEPQRSALQRTRPDIEIER